MTVRVEPLADGAGQVECLRVETKGGLYVGFTLRLRDEEGGWLMVYANSTRRTFGRLVGEVDAQRSTWNSVTPGRTGESRFVSERVGDSWRRTQLVSSDGGATWQVLFTDELQRDAGEPATARDA